MGVILEEHEPPGKRKPHLSCPSPYPQLPKQCQAQSGCWINGDGMADAPLEAQEHRPPPPTKPLPVLGSRARVSHTLPSRSGPQPWRHRDRCSREHLMPDDPRRSCGGDASAGERRQTQRKLRWLTHGSLLLCGGVGVWGTPAFCDPPTSGEDYRSLVLRIWDPGLHRASTRLGFPKQ